MTLAVPQSRQLADSDDISKLLGAWLAALEMRVRAGEMSVNTSSAYRRGAEKFFAWYLAAQGSGVDVDTLRSWKAVLLSEGKKPATVNAWLAGVKAFFSWAVENKRMPYNPAQGVKGASRKGASKRHARESLTDVEIGRLLSQPDEKTLTGRRDRAILYLMAYTAVRTVEVVRANLSDLKTEGGRLVLYVTGKGHMEADELVVIESPKAQNALYDWLAARGEELGPLFLSLSDRNARGRLSTSYIRHMVKGYMKQAGIRGNKSTHSIRHSAITKVILKSGSIQKAQSVARHRSVDTTMIYFHELDRLTNPGEAFIEYGEG